MKRLPEQFDPSNPDEAYLAGLLRHVHPAEPSAEQMQRVWTTLERSSSKRLRGRARGPVIAGLLLCGATVASATMPQVWTRLHRAVIEIAPVELTPAAKAVPRHVPPSAPPPPAALLDPSGGSPALAEAPAMASSPAPSIAVRKSTASKARPTVAEPVDPLGSGVLMVEAIRERRAGNVARARELASEYRTKNPTGALHEEALALCVEAAAALGDEDATQLAGLYLQRYPRGRFRAQAQRVMDNAR
ncbi:MAG TPA: hypothetical protein VK550_24775 [Polyangiaceae bacterium]|nr:hypothetical protein [Polyangiaceae bacterium]